MPEWVQALEKIDSNIVVNSETFFSGIDENRRITSTLFMRSFATFRTTCRLAMSGQIFEATILIRNIIESAVYAWVCCESSKHRDAWKKRRDGEEEKKIARKLFHWSDLIKSLEKVDKKTADLAQKLYDQTIDYGAHPNVAGVALNSEITQIDTNKFELTTVFLQGEDAILLTALDIFQTMELVYRLLELTIKDRLRILNIDLQVDEGRLFVVNLINKYQSEKSLTG